MYSINRDELWYSCLSAQQRRTVSEQLYRVGQKSKPLASYLRKALLFCMYTNSETTVSYIKLFALFLVLNILWFTVADTRMRQLSTHIAKYTHSNWRHTLRHTYNI